VDIQGLLSDPVASEINGDRRFYNYCISSAFLTTD
jgi:hypothetical protein